MRMFRTLILTLVAGLLMWGVVGPLSGVAEAGPRKGGIAAESSGKSGKSGKSGSSKKKSKKGSSEETIRYEVKKGDTLGKIASKHDCSVDDLVRWNRLKSADQIQIGQKLKIVVRDGSSSSSSSSDGGGGTTTRTMTYVVRKGDTLGEIAKKHSVTLEQLQGWNRALRKNPDRLKIGQQIRIEVKVARGKSQSLGHANKGKLSGATRLPEGKGYVRRNSSRAWGTELTVSHLQTVMASYRKKFKKGPDFVIGDISHEHGGPMKPHKSHQSGRDVDIGFVAKDGRQLEKFERMSADTLDAEKNWYVIEALLETGDIEYIFIDYDLQKPLYEAARKAGWSESKLESVFQYPNGKRSYKAIVRHSRGHDGHMHVRFDCPRGDDGCK